MNTRRLREALAVRGELSESTDNIESTMLTSDGSTNQKKMYGMIDLAILDKDGNLQDSEPKPFDGHNCSGIMESSPNESVTENADKRTGGCVIC